MGASSADMEKGMMRFDINVSLRPWGQKEFGTKVEVKNVNSFRSLERALEYEMKRQTELLEAGKGAQIIQETRGWDDERGTTESQRSKEGASDYRYFPEPDLPPLIVEKKTVEKLRLKIPELPVQKKKRFMKEHGLTVEYATLLTADGELADYFEKTVSLLKDVPDAGKKVAHMINNVLIGCMERAAISIAQGKLSPESLAEILTMTSKGDISGSSGKELAEELFLEGGDVAELVKSKGMAQVSDTGFIEALCKKVLDANPNVVAEIKAGKEKAIGFLVGQVMKDSNGQANPGMVSEMLKKLMG